jgi:hypothetical protein
MNLCVGEDAIIQFKMRKGGIRLRLFKLLDGSDVHFPVTKVHRLRIISFERRAGEAIVQDDD